MVNIIRVRDQKELINTAALRFTDAIVAAQNPGGGVHGDGVARVVLTGGGAGIGLLRQLADLDYAAQRQGEQFPALSVDWSRVHVFFGDERNVPVDHPDSNEGQAREALLNHVGIPEANIHGYGLGALSMEEAARAYAETLSEHAPHGFDIHLLGMGGEGHINSLFPHSAATAEAERLVTVVNDSPKPPAERLTLTLPAIRRAKRVWLLVSGAEKAEAAKHVADGSPAVDWPASGAQGAEETLLFLAEDAAALL